jgi:pyruvate formate lyase activating enzyme
MIHDALLYDTLDNQQVQCNLCSHQCQIGEGRFGICQVRENREGKLFTHVYGNLIAEHIDPIEKKPLYHFLPGSSAYSIATPGCNFRCDWCQNWQISQMPKKMKMPERERIPPEKIVSRAIRGGCKSIAYTYTEPTIFFEYAQDVSALAYEQGLKNVYVTNGFMTPEMLEMAAPTLGAANVDIKAFQDKTYRALMGGRLEPVLESCRLMKALGIWLEVTTLVVPGVNDDIEEIEALAQFIADDLGPETPWHISRFFPQYKMQDRGPTSGKILEQAEHIGKQAGLQYIYLGNVTGPSHTYCKSCGQELISRVGYFTQMTGIDASGKCTSCGVQFDGVL